MASLTLERLPPRTVAERFPMFIMNAYAADGALALTFSADSWLPVDYRGCDASNAGLRVEYFSQKDGSLRQLSDAEMSYLCMCDED